MGTIKRTLRTTLAGVFMITCINGAIGHIDAGNVGAAGAAPRLPSLTLTGIAPIAIHSPTPTAHRVCVIPTATPTPHVQATPHPVDSPTATPTIHQPIGPNSGCQ